MLLTPAQIKQKSFESRWNPSSSFLPGVYASHVYVRAWALGCFPSLTSTKNSKHWFTTSFLWRKVPESGARSVTSTQTFRTALTKRALFIGVTKSGWVWRKVPESDARSVTQWHTVTTHTDSDWTWLGRYWHNLDSARRVFVWTFSCITFTAHSFMLILIYVYKWCL